jgi:hypothetical protein
MGSLGRRYLVMHTQCTEGRLFKYGNGQFTTKVVAIAHVNKTGIELK